MPKVNIDCSAIKGFRVSVGWSPGQHMQVATVNPRSGMTLRDDPDADPYPFDGWHVTLDRDGANRLIRALRQARDSAYGRDE